MEFLPLIALALLFWFLILRPQRRRAVEQSRLQDALAPGDEVVTASGLYGRVETLEDDVARVEIAPGTTVRVDRRSIVRRVPAGAESPESSVP